jgi:DNA-binding transcriptional LysR family regulator
MLPSVQMELRHLHVVLTVADAGSISRAATSLKIAQAGLTAQLRRIEQGFGGPLFIRRWDGVELTELGRHVLARSRDLVQQFDDLLVTSRKLVALGCPPGVRLGGVAGAITPMLAGAVRDLLPDRPRTTQMARDCETVVELVAAKKIDIAVVTEFSRGSLRIPEELGSRPLVTEPMFIGIANDHRLSTRAEIRLAELADEEWAIPEETYSGPRLNFQDACEAAGFTPRCAHLGTDLTSAAELVRSQQTVAGFFPTTYEFPGVVFKPLVGNPIYRRMTLVWSPGSEVAGSVRDIHATVLRAYQERVRQHPVYAGWWATHGRSFALAATA